MRYHITDPSSVYHGYSPEGAVVVLWLSVRTHYAGVVSSIPPCVTIKSPLIWKVTGNHLIESTFLDKTQKTVSGFCYLWN